MLQDYFSADTKVNIHPLTKNNNIKLDALIIQEPSVNISPTLYLNAYYEDYQNGSSMEQVIKHILSDYNEHKASESLELSFFTRYDSVKYHIIFKVVSYESNRELLQHAPHFRFLDLAIVFSCLLLDTPNGNATILILNSHMEHWKVTKEQLFAAAKINTPALLPFQICPIGELMEKIMPGEIPPELLDTVPLYVLSNESNLNGAAALLFPEYIEEFAREKDCDVYILPSSVHEVLLMPAAAEISPQALTAMICQVNEKHVQKEDILSYHPYFYSRETREISML